MAKQQSKSQPKPHPKIILNWPSKNPSEKSGHDRGNNLPKK